MAIRVDTTRYEAVHGRTPRQPRAYQRSPWSFLLDAQTEPIILVGRYGKALARAKRLAKETVTVLP